MCALSLSKSSLYPRACVRFCARAKEIRARAKEIRARAGRFARKQGNPRESKGNPRASREIRAQAGRFALAHYINLLSRYKNVLSTFGSKITPYIKPVILSLYQTSVLCFISTSRTDPRALQISTEAAFPLIFLISAG